MTPTKPEPMSVAPLAHLCRSCFSGRAISLVDRALILEKVLSELCHAFGVTTEDILGGSKRSEHCWPRQVGCYLLSKNTFLSSTTVSRMMGMHDHGAALYSVKKVANVISVYETDRAAVMSLSKKLFGNGGGQ